MMNSQLLSRHYFLTLKKFHVAASLNTAKPTPLLDSIIRVDHAGELGADRIYAGQMAVLGNSKMGPLIQHMWDQEKLHKATFDHFIVKYRVRPTAFIPIWNVAGFLLGAGTALMGEKAAMACTVAVESVIVDHYNDQLRALMAEPEKNKELMETIQRFRDDEQEHHDCGVDHGAEQAPFYKALTEVIKLGCKTAIAISKDLFCQRNHHNLTVIRAYSTSTDAKKSHSWDLLSAVCLERKPVIVKSLCDIELKVNRIFSELELENSYKSNHEIKAEEDTKRAEILKTDVKKLDLGSILEQTAHEFEEMSNKEFSEFQKAPLITKADKENDVKSLNRKLSNHLMLLVKKRVGENFEWILPHGVRREPETMRDTAERVLRETCGEKVKIWIMGNAPCGFYKYSYPKAGRGSTRGAKIFFFKAFYISGDINFNNKIYKDYQWATRLEFANLRNKDIYYTKISKFLIDDAVDDDFEAQNTESKAVIS